MLNIYVQDQAVVKRAKRLDYGDNPENAPDLLSSLPLEEAFRRAWPTDAHFLCYFIPGEEEIPPLAKIMLGALRVKGGDVRIQYLAVDLDRVPHDRWPDEETLKAAEAELVQELVKLDLPRPTVYYPTLKGIRLIYTLDEDVPPEKAEPLHRGLLALFGTLNLKAVKVDQGTSDWTRCFRMPDVIRNGERTPEWLLSHIEIDLNSRVHPVEIPEVGPPARSRAISLEGREMPQLETARDILYDDGARSKRQSQFHKDAKRRLQNRDCFPYIWPDNPEQLKALVPPHGERDTTMTRVVGQIVALIFNVPGAAPEHVFGMLLDWISLMPLEEADVDPFSNLWTKILRFWETESFKQEQLEEIQIRQEITEEVERRRANITADEILAAARKTWPPGILPENNDEAMGVLSRRAILSKKYYYILQANGTYSVHCYDGRELYAGIREAGIDGVLVQTMGEERLVPVPNLLRAHMTPLAEVSYQVGGFPPGMRGGIPSRDGGLLFPVTRIRQGLEPKFNKDVHDWLHAFVHPVEDGGEETFDRLCNWISWSFEITNPICAIALVGAPASGKKLFVKGLAECFDPSEIATSSVFGPYAQELKKSVIVNIDEGVPGTSIGGHHPSETFRRLVSGEPIYVNEKYTAPYTVNAPSRVIITSNDPNIIAQFARPGFSDADRRALVQRITFFRIYDPATTYLKDKGGVEHTRGWISSDGNKEDSDFVVARHFLWLRDNYKRRPRGSRLLVEGQEDSELTYKLRAEPDNEANLIQSALNYIEKNGERGKDPQMYQEKDGEIFVTVAFARYLLGPQVSNKTAAAAMQAIRARDSYQDGGRVSSINGIKQRWFRLDKHLLFWAAEQNGYARQRLEELIKARGE
jgi:hypothetical protein